MPNLFKLGLYTKLSITTKIIIVFHEKSWANGINKSAYIQ